VKGKLLNEERQHRNLLSRKSLNVIITEHFWFKKLKADKEKRTSIKHRENLAHTVISFLPFNRTWK
jgi:hypothetical protein